MRKVTLLTFILFIGYSARVYGQEVLIDLQSLPIKKVEPKKAKAQSSAKAALALPFFDDFAKKESTPDPENWIDSFVLINQTYANNPPTVGVATFDAINQYGKLYSHLTTNSLPADNLTSQPINLNLPEIDSIYLSFQYQPKGLGEEPDPADSLMVEFLSTAEGKWIKVWAASAHFTENIIEKYYLENKTVNRKARSIDSSFFKVMLPIKEERFRNEGFQFRFVNYASFPTNNQAPSIRGNGDHWHIDLVYLNKDRYLTDTITNDFAFSKPIKSFLKNYESIPWKHFTSEAIQAELPTYPIFKVQYRNLTPVIWNITRRYIVTDLSNLNPPGFYSAGQDNIDPYETVDFDNSYEYTFASSWADSAKFDMNSHLITETAEKFFRWNDTISYTQKFSNYYAYDDGSAEGGHGLYGEGSQGGKVALKYHSYVSDSLKGILIYFNQIFDFNNSGRFNLVVWNDNNGKPGTEIYKKTVSKPTIRYNADTLYKIEAKIKIGGDFWIGTINRSEDMLNIGFDINNNHNDKLYCNITGEWEKTKYKGSLMMKPVFGKFALGQTGIDKPTKLFEFNIFPNPASNRVSIHLPEVEQPHWVRIVNLNGQILLSKPYESESMDVSNLPAGIYLFQLTLRDQTSTTKKLVIIK
ncbi:MAG: T9SS C-terminal target domain-containing protein [Bacteroidales bacterium]|nr:MAG: T9SS C-terminal target domain-containing protein [Bacteroidales bacterium]